MLKLASLDLLVDDLTGCAVCSSSSDAPTSLPQGAMKMAAQQAGYRAQRSVVQLQAREVTRALERDAVARRVVAKGAAPAIGDLVGVRLNLNVLRTTGVAVHTVHRGKTSGGHRAHRGFWNGEVLCYAQTVTLREALFNVHQAGREAIASGLAAKHPMASVDGVLSSLGDAADFSGVEVRFNPKMVHLFVDEDGRAVRYADEVTMQGNRCYVRGRIVYFDEATWIEPGQSPSAARPAERA